MRLTTNKKCEGIMKVKERKEIDDKFKWKLEDIVASETEWESVFQKLVKDKDKFIQFSGKLGERESILKCLKFEDKISYELTRLYVYAKMRLDQDVSCSKYKSLTDRVESLSVDISTLSSFVTPELAANSKEFLFELAESSEFADYSYSLTELARNKEHTLTNAEEKILAQTASFSGMFADAFSMFDNADVAFEKFVNSDGEEVELSHGLYSLCMQSTCRDDRKKAYESMFGAYKNSINTLSIIYGGNIKKDLFYTKVRKYDNCLARAMNGENVSPKVYEKLIDSVHKNLPKQYEYLEYRRNKLGYDKLYMYDLHMPIVSEDSLQLTYEEAAEKVKTALMPLGDEYQKLLEKAFAEGWIDVYENKGKRSGAYSWGCYGAHPYVLLNYQSTIHDIFTIAHELGHAMHSYYSNKTQPLAKADYEIFVAEVASTVNEMLLLHDLLKKSDGEMKKYLLSYLLDMFRTTVFRQTQFAEFEVVSHKMAENDEPLTPESLCEKYSELNKLYYGGKNVVSEDEFIKYEWARIPHLYRNFYVYKYATGLISAVCISERILHEGEVAVADYKKFLSAGGSMPPTEILKLAGVDLQTDAPYEAAMKYYAEILAELKSLS